MTLAFFANTLQSAVAKIIPAEISGAQYGFHIFSIALLMLLPIVLWRRGNDFKTEILPWHLLRAVAGSSSFLLFMTAVKSIDLINATVLLSTMPILISLIAWVVLHQNIPRGLWLAISIGFAGLVVVVRPKAFTYAKPHQISVFQYTAVIFSAIIGWLFFKEQPDLLVVVGIVLICVGGILAIYLGRKDEPDNTIQVR